MHVPPLNEVQHTVSEASRVTSIYEAMQRGTRVSPTTTLPEVLNANVKALRAIQAWMEGLQEFNR